MGLRRGADAAKQHRENARLGTPWRFLLSPRAMTILYFYGKKHRANLPDQLFTIGLNQGSRTLTKIAFLALVEVALPRREASTRLSAACFAFAAARALLAFLGSANRSRNNSQFARFAADPPAFHEIPLRCLLFFCCASVFKLAPLQLFTLRISCSFLIVFHASRELLAAT